MKKALKNIDFNDILIISGLGSAGTGLYLWQSLGIALTAVGSALFLLAVAGMIFGNK